MLKSDGIQMLIVITFAMLEFTEPDSRLARIDKPRKQLCSPLYCPLCLDCKHLNTNDNSDILFRALGHNADF